MSTDIETIKKLSEHEKKVWDGIFQKELESKKDKKFSSYWWEDYYSQITKHIDNILKIIDQPFLLEAGSGSGKATLLLNTNTKLISLLDVSPVALTFAKELAVKYKKSNVEFIEGNILSMPIKDSTYDLTWNIGVLEHYDKTSISYLLKEMFRVTKENGYIAVGIPNLKSLPIKKAKLLTQPKLNKILKFIPGYRLDSENLYHSNEIKKIFIDTAKSVGLQSNKIEINYLGSPLLVGTPKIFIKFFRIFDNIKFIKERRFLVLVSFKKVQLE